MCMAGSSARIGCYWHCALKQETRVRNMVNVGYYSYICKA